MCYEYRFVEKPFTEMVDGRMCEFKSMWFIRETKEEALKNHLDLKEVEKFILKLEGWIGAYGTYMSPKSLIEDFIKNQ